MITIGPLVVALAIMFAITWPNVAAVPMMVVLIPAAIILPIVLYPVSYTTWQALDIAMRPVEIDDFVIVEQLDEQADLALDDE